jgi:para-nitrobenzyl esterase
MSETLARTSLGTYVGIETDGLRVFRGIPFAMPPVGELRFAPPQALTSRFDRRDATENGPIAPQLPSRLSAVMGNFSRPSSEDCLSLCVWAPPEARDLPVLVWIHGGAWTSGAGSLDKYDGSTLARDGNMIVVGVNYRLGALGYLHHPGISPGNLGNQDIVAALRWINAEIAVFGGDPGRITVAGQSAGAGNIGWLMADPATKGLFRRAILQSGGFGRQPPSGEVAVRRAGILGERLGIDLTAPDAAVRMREVPVDRLLQAQSEVARAIAGFADTTPPFAPMLLEGGSADDLLQRIAEGARGIDLLVGATRDESHAFFALDAALDHPDRARVAERAAALTGREDALELYALRRPGGTLRDLIADITTDRIYRHPTMRLADAVARQGEKVFAYHFDWAPPGSRFGACHCIELPFVFGTFDTFRDAPMLAGGDAAEMQGISTIMRRAWASFVHTGDPATDGSLPWAAYEAGSRWTMGFGRKSGQIGDPTLLHVDG